jgi:hypothetical protein
MTENELLNELAREYKIDDRIQGGVTAEEMESATGLGNKRCMDILNRKVKSGELKKHRVRSQDRLVFEFYKPLRLI